MLKLKRIAPIARRPVEIFMTSAYFGSLILHSKYVDTLKLPTPIARIMMATEHKAMFIVLLPVSF